MGIKLNWDNIGKGLSAIAEAKRESDYQSAVDEERKKFDRRKEQASAVPTYKDFQGEEGSTGSGYLLPNDANIYKTLAAAKTAQQGLMPNEYDYTRSKADLAEKYGFYDRAKQFRTGALADMQTAKAALELESAERTAQLHKAFYSGGGIQGVVDQINQFTGGSLELKNRKGGGYEVYENGKPTGQTFTDTDDAMSYALALASPQSLQNYYKAKSEARIKARTRMEAELSADRESLVEQIGQLVKKDILSDTQKATLAALRERLVTNERQLKALRSGRPDQGSTQSIYDIAEQLRGGSQGTTQTPAPAPAVAAPKAPEPKKPHPLTSAPYPGTEGRIFPESFYGDPDYEDPLDGYHYANGGLVRGYADGGLNDEQRAKRMEHLGKAQEAFSAAHANSQRRGSGDANMTYDPQVDFDLDYEAPQYLASGGLVRGYADGGFFDYIKKSFTEKPDWADDEPVQSVVRDSSGKAVKDSSGKDVTSTTYKKTAKKAKKATESPAEPEYEYDMGDASYLAGDPEPYSVTTKAAPKPGLRKAPTKLPSKSIFSDIYDYLFDPTDRKAAHMSRMERLQMTGDLPYDPGFDEGDTGGLAPRTRSRIPAGGNEYDGIDDAVYSEDKYFEIPSWLLPYYDSGYESPAAPQPTYNLEDEIKRLKAARAQKYSGAFQSGGLVDYTGGGKVKGKGTETSDSNLARLSKNEYVVNAESMKIPGVYELVDAINNMGLQKRKAKKA